MMGRNQALIQEIRQYRILKNVLKYINKSMSIAAGCEI